MLLASAGGPTFQVSGWIAAVGTFAFLVSAVLIIIHSPLARPVRWLYRRLLGEPVTTFFRNVVGEIVDEHVAPLKKELTPNGGSSLVDKVDKLVRSADDTNSRVVGLEHERDTRVPMLLEDHDTLGDLRGKLDELRDYAHKANHDRINDISTLQLAREAISKIPDSTP